MIARWPATLLLATGQAGGYSRASTGQPGTVVGFRILGPLEVVGDGKPLVLGAVQQRALLAVLVLHRGEVVPIDRLIDALWGERNPGDHRQDGAGVCLSPA
jgi:hypothetical protein